MKKFFSVILIALVFLSALSGCGSESKDADIQDKESVTEETTEETTETEVTIDVGETVDSGECGDNLTWTLDDNGNLIIEGTGEMDDYEIDFYDGDTNAPWYDEAESIKVCVIRDGVTSISNYTFYLCTNLTSIKIPDSVTSIGDFAFSGCDSLTSITIPDSITSIGNYAFLKCTSLTDITVKAGNKNYRDIDGVLFSEDKTELVCFPAGKTDTSYTIPEGVTSIGAEAFAWCTSLTDITIPGSVTKIDFGAFNSCTSLTDVYYGGSEGDATIGDINENLENATWHYNG